MFSKYNRSSWQLIIIAIYLGSSSFLWSNNFQNSSWCYNLEIFARDISADIHEKSSSAGTVWSGTKSTNITQISSSGEIAWSSSTETTNISVVISSYEINVAPHNGNVRKVQPGSIDLEKQDGGWKTMKSGKGMTVDNMSLIQISNTFLPTISRSSNSKKENVCLRWNIRSSGETSIAHSVLQVQEWKHGGNYLFVSQGNRFTIWREKKNKIYILDIINGNKTLRNKIVEYFTSGKRISDKTFENISGETAADYAIYSAVLTRRSNP